MAGDDDMNSDDVGWWDCSLCTYKNSADKFKCEICDLRRGTSTRKPRCSTDTIVAQVVKQQEQIQQQTKAKPPPKSRPPREQSTATPEPTTSLPNNDTHPSPGSTITDVSSNDSDSSHLTPPASPANSKTNRSQDNPVKVEPIRIDGNLIKYLPPTSTGRTGLIIDKKRFTQHSVTVDDVTITFTEFATRQNRYVRKKKKKSGKAASSQAMSGIKVES